MKKHEIWMSIAEEDLQAAKWSFKGSQFLWAVFMCQQCIEKAIKAVYIYKNGKEAPKKHDLLSLSKSADMFELLSEDDIELFTYLNIYYIESRYEEKRQELKTKCNKAQTQKIMQKTTETFEWLKNILQK